MTAAILQTPLEVILFFTSLASHGVKPQSFQTISDLLKQDQFIREGEDFDETRLSPESLQQLYLTLIRDEVNNQKEKTKASSPELHENGSPNARKRKLSSPVLQSLGDAQEHEHLLPALINKLYARYRDQAFISIQREEEDYRRISSKLSQLKGNQQSNGGDAATTGAEIKSSVIHDLPKNDTTKQALQVTAPSQSQQAQRLGSPKPTPAKTNTPSAIGSPDATSKDRPERSPKLDTSKQAHIPPSRVGLSSSEPIQNSTPDRAAQIPAARFGADGQPTQAQAQSQTQHIAQHTPKLPTQVLTASPGHRASVPASASVTEAPSQAFPQQQYAQQQAAAGSPAPSSVTFAPSSVTAGRSPVLGPPSLISSPVQSQAQTAQPTFPRQVYPHRGYPQQDQRNVFQQQFAQFIPPSVAYQAGQAPSAHQSVQASRHPQGSLPVIQTAAHSQQVSALSPGSIPKPQYPSTPQQSFQQRSKQHPNAVPPRSAVARHNVPPLDTSASSTKWKSAGRSREKSPDRPKLSPLRFDLDEYFSKEAGEGSDQTTARRSTDVDSARASPADAEETPSRVPAGRGRRGHGRAGGRPASVRAGSASVSTRTRSRSAGSPTEEQSAAHKKIGPRRVKREPGTPAEERMPSKSPSNIGTPLLSGRRRGDTLRSIDTPPNVRPTKRKFELLEVGSPVSTGPATPRVPQVPTKPGHILAVRTLPRIAQTILNDVTTHKLASMFQKPISEREAPGYRDLVFQPQDLKTIRGQLSAGQKAIAAAELAAQEAGETLQSGPTAGSVWLERTADVIPPRAIVNSGQLETEICRIFANAVMFNPDPKRGIGPAFKAVAKRAEGHRRKKLGLADLDDDDGDKNDTGDEGGSLVNDAREMFNDVEKQLAGWRAAERTSAGDGVGGVESSKDESMVEETKDEEEAAATEGEDGRPSRRRRI